MKTKNGVVGSRKTRTGATVVGILAVTGILLATSAGAQGPLPSADADAWATCQNSGDGWFAEVGFDAGAKAGASNIGYAMSVAGEYSVDGDSVSASDAASWWDAPDEAFVSIGVKEYEFGGYPKGTKFKAEASASVAWAIPAHDSDGAGDTCEPEPWESECPLEPGVHETPLGNYLVVQDQILCIEAVFQETNGHPGLQTTEPADTRIV